jgi:hypothetical protein
VGLTSGIDWMAWSSGESGAASASVARLTAAKFPTAAWGAAAESAESRDRTREISSGQAMSTGTAEAVSRSEPHAIGIAALRTPEEIDEIIS